jgi:hypothetical protein
MKVCPSFLPPFGLVENVYVMRILDISSTLSLTTIFFGGFALKSFQNKFSLVKDTSTKTTVSQDLGFKMTKENKVLFLSICKLFCSTFEIRLKALKKIHEHTFCLNKW